MESGGFSMAQAEPLEDLALGYSLRQKAYIVPLLRSEDAASVQMYRERPAFWNGMSRIGAGSLPWLGLRSVITILVITAVMSPILALSNALRTGRQRILAVSSWLVKILLAVNLHG